jgi:hypothetical protein
MCASSYLFHSILPFLASRIRFGGMVGSFGMSGCAPDSAVTFLCFAKEKSPKERRPCCLRPSAALRATCGARDRRGLARTRFAQTIASPDPPPPALLGAARRDWGDSRAIAALGARQTPTVRAQRGRSWYSAVCIGAPAVMRRRVAQVWADQGRACLSRRRVCAHPAQTEQRSVPEAKRRADESGSPSFAYFSWRSKKSECAVGRTTRHAKKPNHLAEDKPHPSQEKTSPPKQPITSEPAPATPPPPIAPEKTTPPVLNP